MAQQTAITESLEATRECPTLSSCHNLTRYSPRSADWSSERVRSSEDEISRLVSVARQCSRRVGAALFPRCTSDHHRGMEAERRLKHSGDLSSGDAYHEERFWRAG